MKVLITGATGFIGSCLARRMVADGHDVYIFVRRNSNTWRIADLAGKLKADVVELQDTLAVEKAVTTIAPRVVFHLATYGGFSFQKENQAIIGSNFIGTINLLNACVRTGFDCFVNTGSSSEYGMKSRPMTEDDYLEPVGDYGVSKAAASLYCRSVAIESKLPITTARLFSPYGPWDDQNRLIPYVITSLIRGISPQLSSPDSVRDFIFIDDVIRLYLKLADQPTQGEIINVGSGRQHTIGNVVSTIAELVSDDAPPCWKAAESNRPEPRSWVANICKAKNLLGWTPEHQLREGLARTIAWFMDNLEYYP
jgi:nucleoside-diphosphate-sugar epimerase